MEKRTAKDIQRALLELLADKSLNEITMAELARKAQVSRSTLYQYYGNVVEVYSSALSEFSSQIMPNVTHHACYAGIVSAGKQPLCSLLREAKEYHSLINENRFINQLLDETGILETHDFYKNLVEHGYSPVVAKALGTFQIGGCFKAVQSMDVDDATWREIKTAIDCFVCGGISACLDRR